MRILTILLSTAALSSAPLMAEQTTGEKAAEKAHDAKRSVKKMGHRVAEAVCMEGDAKCLAEKAANRAKEAADATKDKVKETKDKVD